jgi:hypothetical protein
MRKLGVFICALLTSCMTEGSFHLGEGTDVVQTMSVSKQKQRISLLQKKLEYAERGLKEAQDEVEELNTELHESQLALIAKQIENYEHQLRKTQENPSRKFMGRMQEDKGAPFLKERELLQEMMENGPSPQAFEAQVVLDRILRMITELKDVEEMQ